MSFIKKSSCILLSLSLLTTHHTYTTPEAQKESILMGLFKCGITASFVLVPFGIWHYYNNYYRVDHITIESLLASSEKVIATSRYLVADLSSDTLHHAIHSKYPNCFSPYVTCYAELEDAIYNLYYYKNALNRKISHKEFSDIRVISNISSLISELEIIKVLIEKSTEYKEEMRISQPANTPKFGNARLDEYGQLKYYDDAGNRIHYDDEE